MTAPPVTLVVHHDPERRRVAADELRACGCDATEAPSLEGALALLAERSFDVVVCDAEASGPRRRPVWQIVLAATTNRDTLVALIGCANSHQEMLASCANSRLMLGAPAADVRGQTTDLVRRRFGATLATRHGAEGLDAPHFAEVRVRATGAETS